MLVPDRIWSDNSTNFVTGISLMDELNAICNIINQLSKEHQHIAIGNKINAEELIDRFAQFVWKLHGSADK